MDLCTIVCVSLWPLHWPFPLVLAWVLNYSCVCVCVWSLCAFVYVCALLCVCVEETVSFCGSSNQPPAPSPNTCSPINMQRAGAHSLPPPLLSTLFLPSFLLLLAPSVHCSLSTCPSLYLCFCTPLSPFCSHMLTILTPYCLIPVLLFLFSVTLPSPSPTPPSTLPLACLILP